MEKSKNKTRIIVECAMMVAIAAGLELISKIIGLELPFGGTITVASMFPIVLASYKYGLGYGLLTGFTYSIVQILLGLNTVAAMFMPGDEQMVLWKALCVCFLDYILAYTLLGLGGMFRNSIQKPAFALALGTVAALTLRFIIHIISGAIFYGAWAEWFFTQDGFYAIGEKILEKYSGTSLAIVYSVFYNGLYMIPEIIITTVVAIILGNVPAVTGKKRVQ